MSILLQAKMWEKHLDIWEWNRVRAHYEFTTALGPGTAQGPRKFQCSRCRLLCSYIRFSGEFQTFFIKLNTRLIKFYLKINAPLHHS